VDVNGGTRSYQAPELFLRKAKFSRKADVFASGILFLEMLTLDKPNELYDEWWPKILDMKLPKVLLECIEGSLNEDPTNRIHFDALVILISSGRGSIVGMKDFVLGERSINADFADIADGNESYYRSEVGNGKDGDSSFYNNEASNLA
jgi:serine/threonine protein kinase